VAGSHRSPSIRRPEVASPKEGEAANDRSDFHSTDIHVGRRLMKFRRERGLSQTELARAMGVSFQQVQKYEAGTNRISASRLWSAALTLKVGIQVFFEGLGPGDAASLTTMDRPARLIVSEKRRFPTDA